MSTFFEKLTKSSVPSALDREENPVVIASETPRRPGRPPGRASSLAERPKISPPAAEPKTMHLKVEAEEAEAISKEEEPLEEEGELTVDIYDKGDTIVIQSTVAGVTPENLDISITSDTVTIRGRRERLEEVNDKNYYYKELFWGTFSRSVILPEEIDEEEAEATLKHGLLTIRLPKKKRGVVQKLKVKVT